jgi:hypothetical protein
MATTYFDDGRKGLGLNGKQYSAMEITSYQKDAVNLLTNRILKKVREAF